MSKAELDRLEFDVRVPELQRRAARAEPHLSATGGLILILPRHPAVTAYVDKLAHIERGKIEVDLDTALERFADAQNLYSTRSNFRLCPDIEWSDGGQGVSLTAVIEARADAIYWLSIVNELEHFARIKRQNEWARGFRPRRILTRITDGLIETGRRSRGADPLPIVRSTRYDY